MRKYIVLVVIAISSGYLGAFLYNEVHEDEKSEFTYASAINYSSSPIVASIAPKDGAMAMESTGDFVRAGHPINNKAYFYGNDYFSESQISFHCDEF